MFFNFNAVLKTPAVIQKIREVAGRIKAQGSMMIFVSCSGEIPREVEKEIITIDYQLPKREDIVSIVSTWGDFPKEPLDKLVDAAGVGAIISDSLIR
ncbi:MAG: hypothetical protein GX825_02315 [Syntrophomonadaceae bacterium]|nr:hypothetical protein [Syntrophomonadaceae bacterium]